MGAGWHASSRAGVAVALAGLLAFPATLPAGEGSAPEIRGPISVDGDAQLCDPLLGGALSGVRNCGVADGSAANPYVISGWTILGGPEPEPGVLCLSGNVLSPVRWGVQIAHVASHVIVRDNRVLPDRCGGGLFVRESPNVVLDSNRVEGRATGILVRASPGARILDNLVTGDKGIAGSARGIGIESEDVVVTGNHLMAAGDAFTAGAGIEIGGIGITLDNNAIDGPYNPAVLVTANAAIRGIPESLAGVGKGNTVNGKPLLVLRGLHDVTIDFAEIEAEPLALLDSRNVRLLRPEAPNHPFYLHGSSGVSIENGFFGGYEFIGGGIDGALGIVDSEDVSIVGCRIPRGTNEGITIEGSRRVTVEGCDIRGEELAPDNGLHSHVAFRAILCTRSEDVTIRDNRIQDWMSVGVLLQGCARATVENNLLTEKRTEDAYQIPFQHHPASRPTFAIEVVGSAGAVITGNRIPGPLEAQDAYGMNGILLVETDAVVERNVLDGLDGTGLWLIRAAAEVARNTFARNVGDALLLEDGSLASVANNDFSGNGVAVRFGSDGAPSTAVLRRNGFEGNAFALLAETTSEPVDARFNWWGSADGPAVASSGTGDAVVAFPGAEVRVEPWLGAPPRP